MINSNGIFSNIDSLCFKCLGPANGKLITIQRDALTSVLDGQIIYNTIINKLQVRAAGSWFDLH